MRKMIPMSYPKPWNSRHGLNYHLVQTSPDIESLPIQVFRSPLRGPGKDLYDSRRVRKNAIYLPTHLLVRRSNYFGG